VLPLLRTQFGVGDGFPQPQFHSGIFPFTPEALVAQNAIFRGRVEPGTGIFIVSAKRSKMDTYRCCFLADTGEIRATILTRLRSDQEARDFASALLHRSECALAEVWKDRDMVFLTGRAD